MEMNKVYQGDCMELLKEIPNSTVDLVIADPPYYRIKTDEWDNQWKSFNDYLDWIEKISIEIKRVLKENGSFYIFGDDKNIAYLQVRLDKHFNFLNHLVWYKINNLPIKYAHNHRKFAPVSERILFYSNSGTEFDHRIFIEAVKEIQKYIKDLIYDNGGNVTKANEFYCKYSGKKGNYRSLFFGKSQPVLYTEHQYNGLIEYVNSLGFKGKTKSYVEICELCDRKIYESLRRIFNYQKGIYEIIKEPIIQQKENTIHSTTKPVRLIRTLIQSSSNEGDLVLDPFMGSGSTAVACQQLNRRWVGSEISPEYVALINLRLNQKNIHHFSNTLTSAEVNPAMQESLISVKRESVDSQNSPHDLSTNKEEANFS